MIQKYKIAKIYLNPYYEEKDNEYIPVNESDDMFEVGFKKGLKESYELEYHILPKYKTYRNNFEHHENFIKNHTPEKIQIIRDNNYKNFDVYRVDYEFDECELTGIFDNYNICEIIT